MISVYIHGVEIIKKNVFGKVVFWGGSMEPLWAPAGVNIPRWSSGLVAWLMTFGLGFETICCLIFQIILKLFKLVRK